MAKLIHSKATPATSTVATSWRWSSPPEHLTTQRDEIAKADLFELGLTATPAVRCRRSSLAPPDDLVAEVIWPRHRDLRRTAALIQPG